MTQSSKLIDLSFSAHKLNTTVHISIGHSSPNLTTPDFDATIKWESNEKQIGKKEVENSKD